MEPTGSRENVAELKILAVKKIQDHCCNRLFTLKVFLPDHLTEYLGRSESLEMQDASLFGQYGVHVMHVHRHTSQFLSSSMAKMRVNNQDMNDTVIASNMQVSPEGNRKRSVRDKLKKKETI